MGIQSLLRPSSIAIVGASDKVGPGFNAWNALQYVGYRGNIYLVNPNRPDLLGQATFPSLDAIPGAVDAVFVSVQAESVPGIVRQAAEKRAGALAILSSGFGEAGPDGLRLQREIAASAAQHGLAVCGPNCLGLLNLAGSSALFGTSLPDRIERGRIAAVVQSGSIGIALLNAARGIGLSYLITTGNEAVTTAADYLEALVEDDAVGAMIIFAEQIRKPQKFVDVVRNASEIGKPVIVLKSGRSERGRAAVMAHTGALAGSAEACDAALRAAGAIQVMSLDEMIETAALVSKWPRAPRKSGVGALSLSGGEIALALDAAEEANIYLPDAGPVQSELAAILPKFANISNPLDLTWAGLYDPDVARRCAGTLASHEDVGTLVLLQDAPKGLGPQQAGRYARLLASVSQGAKEADIPLVAVSNLSGDIHPELAAAAGTAGIPYLRGTTESFRAIGRYARWAAGPARRPVRKNGIDERDRVTTRIAALGERRISTEQEARAILEPYGIAGTRERLVTSVEEAIDAAAEIGFPVVLKCIVADLLHKTEAGLVQLDLRSEHEFATSARAMLERAQSHGRVIGLLVQQQVRPIAELFVGGRVDPDFGPIILVGAGGVLVELYRDIAVRPAPIDEDTALETLNSTRIARVLDGFRGRPRADKRAAAEAISMFSWFIADFADQVAEIEINPLAVLANGAGVSALDCALVLKSAEGVSDREA